MKRKISLFLNIASICMCVCALVIGVISAKRATANISGSIGFTAYNCEVEFKGTITGAVKGSTSTVKSTSPTLYIQATSEPSDTLTSAPAIPIGGEGSVSSSLNFGNLAFALDDNYDPYQINFTFSLTNKSEFAISATLNLEEINLDPSMWCEAANNNTHMLKIEKNATKEFVVRLVAYGKKSITATNDSSKIKLSFEKYNVPTLDEAGFEGNIKVSGSDKYIVLTGVPEKTSTTSSSLTIPAYFSDSDGNLLRVPVIGAGSEHGKIRNIADYSSVKISEGVEMIADEAFQGVPLTSVDIPISVRHIGISAFWECTDLETVTFAINGNVKNILDYAFSTTKINSITLPHCLMVGPACFKNCESLTTVVVANYSYAQSIGRLAFAGCTALNSLTFTASAEYEAFGSASLSTVVSTKQITAGENYADFFTGDGCEYDWYMKV